MAQQPIPTTARQRTERRRQIHGLLLVAIAMLIFDLLHAGRHTIFTPSWRQLW
jgi:hypothetical protein